MKKEPKIGLFFRMTEKNKLKFKLTCTKRGVSYEEAVMQWVNG